MDPAYAAVYRDLARRHWWWQARNARVAAWIDRLLAGRRDARTLDIGCGDAVLFPLLARYGAVEGVEPDRDVVTPDGPWRHAIQIRPFDATFAPADRYDLIVMLDVLEHLDDPAAALRHAASLLRPGGQVLLTVPAFRALWTHHDDVNRHVTRFTRATLAGVVRSAGLTMRTSEYLFQWLFAAKLVERLREWLLGPAPLPAVPNPVINRVVYLSCRAEAQLGGPLLPFGSSLLAVLSADAPA